MLVIEIDGETHNWEETQRKDFQKETRLNELGLNVLRFPDSDIFNHLESTLETIKQYIIGFEKGDLSELQYEDSPLNPLTGNVVVLNPLSIETHPLPLSREENDTPLNPLSRETHPLPLSRGENDTPLNPLSRGDLVNPSLRRVPEGREVFKSLEDVYEQIGEGRLFTRQQANDIVNSIKICDPAVGSGHFLVSALNEMIAVKNDLKILQDRDGKRLKEYQVEVVNDELIVTDEEGALFEYTPPSPLKRGERGVSKHLPYPPQGGNARGVSESQRVQETLFHEKQTIIENCLFGVDINSNSVKICRLRLWIELLKNAYYKDISTLSGAEAYTKLETLPNIDINIKCGNSLVSRFAIDADLKQALKKSKWTIDSYRIAVATYRNAESKEQKREMERLIAGIKSDFRSEISANDPKIKKLRKLSGDLYQMTNQGQLFEMSQKEKADWNKRVQQLTQEISKLEAEIEEIKSNKIFENAFEWRFEFPEVLNDDGDFVGFDVVIGNPPYISTKEISPENKLSYSINYKVAVGQFDLYLIFTELAFNILKQNGSFSFITSNTYISNKDCLRFREFIVRNTTITEIINLDETIFTDAHLDVGILSFVKIQPSSEHAILIAKNKDEFLNGVRTKYFISRMVNSDSYEIKFSISEKDWLLFDKMNVCPKLKNFVTITRGIEFGGNSNEIFDNPFEDSYPILVGNSIGKYQIKEIKGYSRYNHNELAVFKPLEIYTQPRILIQRIRNLSLKDRIIATFIEDSMLSTNTLRVLLRKNESTNLKYLLGILNSRLINYYFRLNFNNKDIYAYQLAEVPIKYDLYFEKEIIELVTQILEIKKNNPEISTAELENQIDQLVYQLYELTEDEIKIVEGNG